MRALLAVLESPEFAGRTARLPGYDGRNAGRRVALDAALTWVERPRMQIRS